MGVFHDKLKELATAYVNASANSPVYDSVGQQLDSHLVMDKFSTMLRVLQSGTRLSFCR